MVKSAGIFVKPAEIKFAKKAGQQTHLMLFAEKAGIS